MSTVWVIQFPVALLEGGKVIHLSRDRKLFRALQVYLHLNNFQHVPNFPKGITLMFVMGRGEQIDKEETDNISVATQIKFARSIYIAWFLKAVV